MIIKNVNFSISQLIALAIYYGFLYWIPFNGKAMKTMRRACCKRIFKHCGKNVTIMNKANFGSGRNIEIGDNSGLGLNCCIPSNTIIGDNVMMGPNVYIFSQNHVFDSIDIPMIQQGISEPKQTIIEDDVWIGRNVLMTPGRHIRKGTIIAAGTVLCKDFNEYAIIGGNPSKLIRYRN